MGGFNVRRFIRNPGRGIKNAAKSAVKAAPYAAAALAIPGVGAAVGKGASAIGLGGLRRILPNTKLPIPQGTIPGLTLPGQKQGGGGFDWGSLLGGLKNNAVDIGIGGLAGYQALQSAKASKRAGELQDKAIGGAEKRWSDNEALRSEARRRLLNPTRPDLSSVYADPTNPFAKRATPAVAMPQPTPTVPVGPVPMGIPKFLPRPKGKLLLPAPY